MTKKEIIVRLIVDEQVEEWGDGVETWYELEDFEFVSSDIPPGDLLGIGEDWAQSDRYYETVQNLVGIFDD